MIMSTAAPARGLTIRPSTYATIAERNEAFVQMVPTIRTHARIRFRHLPQTEREEAVAEVVANAFVAFAALVARNEGHRAYPSPLAAYAVSAHRGGRRVGTRQNGKDITSRYCQIRTGVVIERLDRWDEDDGCWREVLVEDKKSTPAQIAAIRIDFHDWIKSLPRRDRQIAQLLAVGEATHAVASRFRLSRGRISQLRIELRDNWVIFTSDVRQAESEE
jgi:hypothetical protein